ncbi:Fe2+-dependent dioxygenase [Psychrobacter raelei]|uniref:Fe2+-dependent dioxygenase n=1 Tax=Psychrobacter raelei TaxID=2565531 RepID=A0AAT9PC29_9GAMM|nr:Fe2+-dependent dioxygenase [Psychrobacter sp. PraFG1]UNK04595.1 Fe2+-dependent dioxygenase [Psychrobacter sp. PraFG1]
MLHIIENLLDTAQLSQLTSILTHQHAQWQDGKLTAGISAQQQKNNWQLSRQDPSYQAMANLCLEALQQHPVFMSAALPKVIMPPLFSAYQLGQGYGMHVDNALQIHPDSKQLMRTDLSLTLFLNNPADYEGGELIISDEYGEHSIKLSAGDAVLYPSTSLHRVNTVTSGQRLAMVTWVQSLVRSDEQRQILHDLDVSHILLRQKLLATSDQAQSTQAQRTQAQRGQLSEQHSTDQQLTHQAIEKLNQSYHNLLRLWAES